MQLLRSGTLQNVKQATTTDGHRVLQAVAQRNFHVAQLVSCNRVPQFERFCESTIEAFWDYAPVREFD